MREEKLRGRNLREELRGEYEGEVDGKNMRKELRKEYEGGIEERIRGKN